MTRIMPLGDSITSEPGGWRAMLRTALRSAGHDVEFVGSLVDEAGERHEGHSGCTARDLAGDPLLTRSLSATEPDIVLLHLGTNDLWRGGHPSDVMAAYGVLTGQIRSCRGACEILLAQLIPMDPADNRHAKAAVERLNALAAGWAESIKAPGPPVTVVDQWSGFDIAADTSDGVHPNAAGGRKIAARWFGAVEKALERKSPMRHS